MRNFFMYIVFVFLVAFPTKTAAYQNADPADSTQMQDLCTSGAFDCREVAIGVVKKQFQNVLMRNLAINRISSTALCLEDNPNCCPPKQGIYCGLVMQGLMNNVSLSLGLLGAGGFGPEQCPWGPAACDFGMNAFYCGASSYIPWLGCVNSGTIFPSCPWGFERGGSGVCEPIHCPPGSHSNGKVCVPDKCYIRGMIVPCALVYDEVLVRVMLKDESIKKVSTYLSDPKVQMEALKHLKVEMMAGIEQLDKMIRKTKSD